MSNKQSTPFHAFGQQMAANRAVGWFGARWMVHIDRLVLRLSGGRRTMGQILTGLPVVEVTTRGAKSGLVRSVILLGIPDPQRSGTIVLIGTNWGNKKTPAWCHNLKAYPRATCRVDDHLGEYLAREASGEEYERYWKLANDIYAGFGAYKQRVGGRHIPIWALEPLDGGQ